MAITVTVSETPTYVTVNETTNNVTLNQSDNPITISTTTDLLTAFTASAGDITIAAHGTWSGGNLQNAFNFLTDQFYRQASEPTGDNLAEGDLWYDTDDDQLKVYRETSANTFEFVPLAQATDTMNNLDGGLF